MGKFANSAEEMGEQVSHLGNVRGGRPWNGESEFDAMGCEVPMFRRAAAEHHLKDMGFTDAEQRFDIVNAMSYQIGKDNSHAALETGLSKGLDATGCYRVLSVLLCAERLED